MLAKIKHLFLSNLKKLNNPLFRKVVLVGSIVLLIKVLSFYKETIVGAKFGLSELLDTYYIAILIPSFVQNAFIGTLKNLFIPNYITEMKTSNSRGSFQAFALFTIAAIVIGLTLIIILFSDVFLEQMFTGHTEGYYALIRKQLYVVLPSLIFWGYSSFLGGLLEINDKYFHSTIAQIFTPLCIILMLVFFKDLFEEIVLVLGMLIGSILGFLFLLFSALRFKLIEIKKIKVNSNMRVMLQQYPPKLTSSLLTGINPFVDQFFAAQLVIGSVAAINYGVRIPKFTVGILVLAIGNVLLPHFSRMVNDNLRSAYKNLSKILRTVFTSALVIALLMIVFSDDIIRILFERGKFTADDTYVVANIQRIALIYVPFYLCTIICVKFLTALNKNKFMAWTSLWNLALNLVLNIILVKKFGLYGLVLSTAIVYVLASFIYLFYTYSGYRKHLSSG